MTERNAVRCYLIKDNKVMTIKYKEGRLLNFYDIPGGKIEENESIIDASIREFKEETGIDIINPIHRGKIYIEYLDNKFNLDILLVKEYVGSPKEFEENSSEWLDINELLSKDKLLSNSIVLDRFFINQFLDETKTFEMYIKVDENENILSLDYKVRDI